MAKASVGEISEKIQKQLEALEDRPGTVRALRARQFSEVVEALRGAMQEIEAVEEELRIQNEDLLSARETLEVERHRYRDLFELAPDGFLVTDLHGVIHEANQASYGLLNASRRALVGKPVTVFIALEQRGAMRTRLAALRPGEELRDLEVTLLPRDLGPRAAQITVARDMVRPAAPPRLFWIVRDLSQRRAAEEALRTSEERLRHSQRLESVGRLAGGIAHSFNNLLAAIGFHAGLLIDDMPPESCGRRHAEEILKAGDRAAALARQLLAFGRKQVLQPRILRINQVIETMEPMMRRLIGEHILLKTDLCPADEPVCVDLGQLEQVILNLVVNARDAMPDGGRLTLATAVRELREEERWSGEELRPGTYMALSVRDDGMGMAPETRSHLFEPFFTTKDRDKGTGLGLATVHGIVHQSGGGVRVESELGEGATFTVLFPRAEESEAAPPAPWPGAPAESGISISSAARGSEVVLVVEDEDNIREPMTEILEARGYTVFAAREAGEALAICDRHAERIDLLITDMMMPGMSGSQLAGHLSQTLPDLRVLYISGYPESSVVKDGFLQAGRPFLQKPFPPGVLLSAVRSVLDNPVTAVAAP